MPEPSFHEIAREIRPPESQDIAAASGSLVERLNTEHNGIPITAKQGDKKQTVGSLLKFPNHTALMIFDTGDMMIIAKPPELEGEFNYFENIWGKDKKSPIEFTVKTTDDDSFETEQLVQDINKDTERKEKHFPFSVAYNSAHERDLPTIKKAWREVIEHENSADTPEALDLKRETLWGLEADLDRSHFGYRAPSPEREAEKTYGNEELAALLDSVEAPSDSQTAMIIDAVRLVERLNDENHYGQVSGVPIVVREGETDTTVGSLLSVVDDTSWSRTSIMVLTTGDIIEIAPPTDEYQDRLTFNKTLSQRTEPFVFKRNPKSTDTNPAADFARHVVTTKPKELGFVPIYLNTIARNIPQLQKDWRKALGVRDYSTLPPDKQKRLESVRTCIGDLNRIDRIKALQP